MILTTTRPFTNEDRHDLWKLRRDWVIQYDPKPIPDRRHDWSFHHVDFDGAPDSNDKRCGTAKSEADAISQIQEISSPPERQPQGIVLATCIDALGLCLAIGLPVALVIIAAAFMETGI